MSTVMPQGEMIRKAAAYVAEQRKENPKKSLNAAIDEAGMKFNLTPLDSQALERLFAEEKPA